MVSLLRRYIAEALIEVQANPACADQLVSKKGNGKTSGKKDSDEEVEEGDDLDEMNVVANIAGFTGPLGASADDMGRKPVKPGGRLKKSKKNFVRWK